MQNRSFDIAGPNPTPEEQKHIDEQYTAFLERERKSKIAAAFTAKQQQLLQQASLRQTSVRQASAKSDKVPLPVEAPNKAQARARAANCAQPSFSCDWPWLSEGIKDLKKLFSGPSSPSKAKRG